VAWSVTLNPGYSGASVRGDEVYVMDREPGLRESMVCLDLQTGQERWRHSYAVRKTLSGFDGSRHQPAVDTNLAIAVGPLGNVIAVDRATGTKVWELDLVKDFPHINPPVGQYRHHPRWGYAQCPVLYRDTVIVAPHATNAGLVALEKTTGRVRWRSADIGPNDFSFVSPELVDFGGTAQILTIGNLHTSASPPALLSSVDAHTGAVLWQTRTKRRYNVPIPQPVHIGGDRIFYTGGYRIGSFLLEARKSDTAWRVSEIAADSSNCTAHIQSPVFSKGHLYAQSFDVYHNPTNNGMVCLDTNLAIRWRSADHGLLFDSGAFLIADNLLFVLHGQTGELFLLDADPSAFRVLARARVFDPPAGSVWAPMSLANGRLLVRDQTSLKCLLVGRPSGPAP
jgi:outer membrane protein assembly factor BamB